MANFTLPILLTTEFSRAEIKIKVKKSEMQILTQNVVLHRQGDFTETVDVDFDPDVTNYENLLKLFWSNHNPSVQVKQVLKYSRISFEYPRSLMFFYPKLSVGGLFCWEKFQDGMPYFVLLKICFDFFNFLDGTLF